MKGLLIFCIFLVFNMYLLMAINITGFDVFSVGDSGEGELIIGGGQDSGPTGIPESEEAATPASSGGGGGGGVITIPFSLDKSFFSIKVKKGENYQEKILVTSNRDFDLTFFISVELSKNFVFPEEETFILMARETREIKFNIYVSEKEETDVYIGKIFFDSQGSRKTVNFVLDVEDKVPLFDIKTTILKKYIFPGRKVLADLLILNLGDLKNIDIELEYSIIDFDNNTYTSKKETFAINESFEGEVFLETPRNLRVGDYLFFSKVTYQNITANSFDTFTIEKFSFFILLIFILVNVFLIVFVGGWIIYLSINKDQQRNNNQLVSDYNY